MANSPFKKKIVKSFGGKDMEVTEDAFVTLARTFLSNTIIAHKDAKVIHNTFKYLKEQVKDRDTFELQMESFPSWWKRTFKITKWKQMKEEEFRSTIAEEVLKKANWVSEMEVTIIKGIIKRRAKIELKVLNDKIPKTLQKDVIYVLNLDEVHYNAVVPRVVTPKKCEESSKLMNPETKRCVGKTSCKGYEVLYNTERKKGD